MKTHKNKSLIVLGALAFMAFFSTQAGCRKDDESCFDRELYYEHINDFCTADCPGVTGCDGKTYCNECEARKVGIRVNH